MYIADYFNTKKKRKKDNYISKGFIHNSNVAIYFRINTKITK